MGGGKKLHCQVAESIMNAMKIATMIERGWLSISSYINGVITLLVYPEAADQYVVQIDLNKVLPGAVSKISENDISLCKNPASVVIWKSLPEADQIHIDLTEYISS